jgi:hypothetical protein
MSTSIGTSTTKNKESFAVTSATSQPTEKTSKKEKAPAIDLTAQPATSGPSNLKAFYDQQVQPSVSPGCVDAVASGKSPAELSAACTVREFTSMARAPMVGATPVTTDAECVKAYEKEGAAWGEAVGDEAKSIINAVAVPVVRQRVAKAVKQAISELAKDAAHTQGVADCKVVADPGPFAKNHAPEPNFTPADPSKAMSKVK